jgi:hypothetical protein
LFRSSITLGSIVDDRSCGSISRIAGRESGFLLTLDGRSRGTAMRQLSVELRYLIYVAILLALIFIPYILAHIAQVGAIKALSYPTPAP